MSSKNGHGDMNIKLALKMRPVRGEIMMVPRNIIQTAMRSADPKQALYDAFAGLPQGDSTVHDKAQLETIAYWVPTGGLPAREDAQWTGLRIRIANLNDTVEKVFTVTPGQFDLIWKRLTNPEFKIVRPSEQWSGFLKDLMLASGKHFSEAGDDLFDDPDAEPAADPAVTAVE